jgi:hypothetical protein
MLLFLIGLFYSSASAKQWLQAAFPQQVLSLILQLLVLKTLV